jgi:hypothetical protein
VTAVRLLSPQAPPPCGGGAMPGAVDLGDVDQVLRRAGITGSDSAGEL